MNKLWLKSLFFCCSRKNFLHFAESDSVDFNLHRISAAFHKVKMEILKYSRKMWKIFGFQSENDVNQSARSLNIGINLLIVFSSLFSLIFAIMYWQMGCAETAEAKIYVILEVLIAISGVVPYVLIIARQKRLFDCIGVLEQFIDTRLSPKTANIYVKAEQRSERVAKWPLLVALGIYDGIFPAISISFWIMGMIRGPEEWIEGQSTLKIW